MAKEVCDIRCVDNNKIARLKPLAWEETVSLAQTFKAMGDTTRVRILQALSQEELCVCELSEILEMTQSAISHQLRLLRNLRLVKYRKEGKKVFYTLDDEHIINLFAQGLAHVRHN